MILLGDGMAVGELRYGEACSGKGFNHFISRLEGIELDAWADAGHAAASLCTVPLLHLLQGMADDVLLCTAPSGMNGCCSVMLRIIDEHGDAVGSGDAEADSPVARS